MYNFREKTKKGFSLIELMVVISIIIILLTIVMASIMEARKKSRDERRVSDVSNIALAMTLYKEKNRSYPVYPNGIELGKGGELDDDIKLFNGNTYTDPLNTGTYGYWYYSNVLCSGQQVNIVVAKSVERSGTSNYAELCGGGASSARVDVPTFTFSFVSVAHAQPVSGSSCTSGEATPPLLIGRGGIGASNGGAYLRDRINAIEGSKIPLIYNEVPEIYSNGATGDKACQVLGYDKGTILGSRSHGDPENNSMALWNTSTQAWNTLNATGYNSYINRISCTCVIPKAQCNDNLDNDGDTLVDMADPGCTSSTDDSEVNVVAPPPAGPNLEGSYIIILK